MKKVAAPVQKFLNIAEIKDDTLVMKDGSLRAVLLVSSVNFALKSEEEQEALVSSYVTFLNYLDFPIQIVITSQKKNIANYLALLNSQKQKITNPLLKLQLEKYYAYIQKTVAENDVLDKKFYLVIPFSSLELGITSTLTSSFKKKSGLPYDKATILTKAKNSLIPKRDHLLKQLTRIGLKAKQLATPDLIKLFFSYYNPDSGNIDFNDQTDYSAPIVEAAISMEKPNET